MPEELKNLIDQVEAAKAEIVAKHNAKLQAEADVAAAQARAQEAVAGKTQAAETLGRLKGELIAMVNVLYTPVEPA